MSRPSSGPAHLADRVSRQIVGVEVADRGRRGAHREDDPLVAGALHDLRISEHVIAVVDPLAPEEVEARRDVLRGGVLARMRGQAKTAVPGKPIRIDELLRRVGRLGAVHAEPEELVAAVLEDVAHHVDGHLR